MATVTAEIGLLVYNLSPQSQTQQSSKRGATHRDKKKTKKQKKNNKIDKGVKARVETGLVRIVQRMRGQKKKRLNHHAQIERESVSFKSSGQANKAFIRRRPELDRQMLLMV